MDERGRPTNKTHLETTLSGAKRIAEIANAIHANGGKVIANINITLPWEVGNVEPYTDALTAGFDTDPAATLDVIFGRFQPVGRLPVTLRAGMMFLPWMRKGFASVRTTFPVMTRICICRTR